MRERRYAREQVRLDLAQAERWRSLSLPLLFERAGLPADKPALVFQGTQRTWAQMRTQVRKVGHALIALGVQPADRVALLSKNRLEYLEIETGIAAACGIMVAINWRLRPAELEAILVRSGAMALFVESELAPAVRELSGQGRLPALEHVIVIDGEAGAEEFDYQSLLSASPSAPVPRQPQFEDPHEIIFTSGTTGQAKGAVWTNGGLFFNALQQVVDYRIGPDCSSYAMIDLFYVGGRHDFTWAVLQAGGTVHIKPSGGFDAEAAVAYTCEHRMTHVLWVPTMIYEILRVPDLRRFDSRALRMIMCGGQSIAPAVVRRMQEAFPHSEFVQVYGLTEGGGSVTYMPAELADAKPGSAGRPAFNVSIRITGVDEAEVASGVDGEICLQAPSVMAGYWDEPQLTAEQVVDDWLHTGDIGHVDEDGYLYVTGRKKDMIKTGGMNVFPSEIEDVLREHPAVLDAAVIGLPHEKWGEQVCAIIERRGQVVVTEDELIDHCVGRLAGFKKPSRVIFVDAMPRTSSGKPQKFVLKKHYTA